MSASGSASGAQRTGSPGRGSSPARLGRSRAGSAPGQGAQPQEFDRSTYPLRDKEGISKRLDLPPEAYYHVGSSKFVAIYPVLTVECRTRTTSIPLPGALDITLAARLPR